jgi:hypothetical protein
MTDEIYFINGTGRRTKLTCSELGLSLLDSVTYQVKCDGKKPVELKGTRNIQDYIEKNNRRGDIQQRYP